MSTRTVSAAVLILVLASSAAARADINVAKSDQSELDIGAMAQGIALGQSVDDPYKNDDRVYLFMKEARLRMTGHHDDVRFRLELGLGGEDAVVAPNPGISLSLLDLTFEVPLLHSQTTYFKVGQFKVPYSREQLTYSGEMVFAERSIEELGFDVGRDVGAAIVTRPGLVTVIGGVFAGGGRDIPPDHYLPEKIGFPLVALRAGIGNLNEDPFLLSQMPVPLDHTRGAFYVNGIFTRDSLVGHSTLLNVKLADKSLLIDPDWNPFIARAPFAQGDWWQAGADGAVHTPLGAYELGGEAEAEWAGYQNSYGVLHIGGARAQVSLSRGPVSVAARYAFLAPDEKFAMNGVQITGSGWIHEATAALTWVINPELKLIAEGQDLIDTPVFTEKDGPTGVGSYVGTELPDETTILGKTGTVGRQNVLQGQVMLQAQF